MDSRGSNKPIYTPASQEERAGHNIGIQASESSLNRQALEMQQEFESLRPQLDDYNNQQHPLTVVGKGQDGAGKGRDLK